MKYKNAISELLMRFPMLKEVYESEGDYIEDLPHPVYFIVFVQFIERIYNEQDEKMMQAVCDFMEEMANSEDEMIVELLGASVLESMINERAMVRKLKQYMGPETLKHTIIIEDGTGWSRRENEE